MYKNFIKVTMAMVFAIFCATFADGIGLMSEFDDIMSICGIIACATGFMLVEDYAQFINEWLYK